MHLKETLEAYQKNDPAARSKLEVLLLYNGLHAIIIYRISHWLWLHRCRFLARLLSQLAKWLTGVEIHPAAKIEPGVFIDHGMGVVIGETAVIGDRIYTDIKSGINAGAHSILVMSGETTEEILNASKDKPELVLPDASYITKAIK